ncbi:MAG: bifunctional 2-C-methyl-D-erythritol 4-phosphate cytidylyltransferase/2-C-methyl-D-erythritol 2,4-cyclodiphosphate synthase [Hyphomicrobiales bacterium]|nr:bifunctional 2-C-methyl-D-erythritol 4-phosphate cytidylyltransferase/2-C-methyl-D-erythritol 2,4-cyclodiphosphate synthase [Hyphomicrobiales bacterium]MCP4998006.1 bifunctional 2-C-methyl-D-erythritol 4-phosphate cytidylyltransferase/2-C-methyl-D-erythritol 2,4-cyclodiphosphate synthase [Hyphomicrobiales bacterium]
MSEFGTIGAVIVAAGRGERAGNTEDGPKQYRLIGGRDVLSWTLQTFQQHPRISQIAIVIHPDDHPLFTRAAEKIDAPASFIVVEGGTERQDSVRRGLEAFNEAGITHVLIHDGVRPFVDHALIDRVIDAFDRGADAVLPALAIADTLKKATEGDIVEDTVAREGLYVAQTPQGFDFLAILSAHRNAAEQEQTDFTDDSAIAEWAGMSVKLVDGDPENVKLTVARDIELADQKLKSQSNGPAQLPDVRTGNGYDVHALVPGSSVVLCGLEIPHDHALSGHSDADVALHALTDALLATCGKGDIGDHFPPSDPQWKGADSRIFLRHAVDLVAGAGGTIMNADVTLICEAPKIGPHKLAMRENLAEIVGIGLDRCSVKATTNEKIGFVGRREGIAAIATATVLYGAISDD